MIVAHDLHRWYGRTHAVRGVSLDIPRNQIVGLLGPNGAGKSTTIRMLAGVLRPDRGSITLNGIDALRAPERARQALGYLPESAAVYTEMAAISFLRHRAEVLGLAGAKKSAAVSRAADLCNLDHKVLKKRAGALSKGYRQRLALAAAILHDPAVLILDEPTNGLDPTQLRDARSLIGGLAQDRTVILCSHVLSEVERLCERIVIIAGGRVLADGTIADLRSGDGSTSCIAEVRLSPTDTRSRLTELDASIETEPAGDGWTRVRVRAAGRSAVSLRTQLGSALVGVETRELRDETVGLEEVFVRVLDGAETR